MIENSHTFTIGQNIGIFVAWTENEPEPATGSKGGIYEITDIEIHGMDFINEVHELGEWLGVELLPLIEKKINNL